MTTDSPQFHPQLPHAALDDPQMQHSRTPTDRTLYDDASFLYYSPCSAKSGEGVEEAFYWISLKCVQSQLDLELKRGLKGLDMDGSYVDVGRGVETGEIKRGGCQC
jgi:hypothetical protein